MDKIKTKDEAITALTLFNAKYEKMVSYTFFDGIENKISIKLKVGKDITTQVSCQTDEQIDAVLLHLRFFSANNEHSSFNHIQDAYNLIEVNEVIKNEFELAFKNWMDWRHANSGIEGKMNHEFMAIMQFGGRIHRNNKKRVRL